MTKKSLPLKDFTFPDSGVEVQFHRISPYTAIDLRNVVDEPKPPMQEVDYGDGKMVLEPNPAHPDYIKAVSDFNTDFEKRLRLYMINQALVFEVADWQEEIDKKKQYFAEELKKPLTGSDREIFISHIAISSTEDLNAVMAAVMGISQPTPEAVAAAKASFRG
jgi:hypothetical protein